MSNTPDLFSDPEDISEDTSDKKTCKSLKLLFHKYSNIYKYDRPPPFSLQPYEADFPNISFTVYDAIKNLKLTHLYRTISEILELKDVKFYCNSLRIMGYFIQINGISYLKELHSNKKIELDFDVYEADYPPLNSVRMIFGTIEYKQIEVENKLTYIPYIIVKFCQFVEAERPDVYHKVYKGIRDILSKVIFETVPIEIEIDYELSSDSNDENSFSDIETTFCLDNLESDEMLFYEIEKLMNIDLSLFE